MNKRAWILFLSLCLGIAQAADKDSNFTFLNNNRAAVLQPPIEKFLKPGDIYLCVAGGFANTCTELIYSAKTGRVVIANISNEDGFDLNQRVHAIAADDDLKQRMIALGEKVKTALAAKLPLSGGPMMDDGSTFYVIRMGSRKAQYLVRTLGNKPLEAPLQDLLNVFNKETQPKATE